MKRIASIAGTTAAFVVLGPLSAALGITALIGMGLGAWPGYPAGPTEIGLVFLLVLTASYMVGSVPALITGIIASIASLWTPSSPVWIAVTVVLGVAASLAWLGIGDPLSMRDDDIAWQLFAASGAGASLVGALVSLTFRPRRVTGAMP